MKQRTFEISKASGTEVTKKEASCFIHQLAKDASKPQSKQLFKWRRDTDAGVDAGPSAFCCEGLTEGSLIKLCAITENGQPGVQFAFFKNGELWYACQEFGGDFSNDMHLACLHKMVAKVIHTAPPEATPTSHTKEKFTMTTPQQCTLTITCADGDEVTKHQHFCFVHNLIADIKRDKPLIQWRRSNSRDGIMYCSNGLAEGTLMTLRMLTDTPGVEFTYSRRGKLIYTATETDGDVNCDMHLAHLLHKVICVVTLAEVSKKPDPLAQLKEDRDKKDQKPQQELPRTRVADMFRRVTAEQIVNRILCQPSMLSINVAEGSPEFHRLETLIRAVVGYIQAVRPINSRYLLKGFALKSATGNPRVCHHIMFAPMSDIAGAFAELDDKVYGGLNPAERTEKYVADVVTHMLTGI